MKQVVVFKRMVIKNEFKTVEAIVNYFFRRERALRNSALVTLTIAI